MLWCETSLFSWCRGASVIITDGGVVRFMYKVVIGSREPSCSIKSIIVQQMNNGGSEIGISCDLTVSRMFIYIDDVYARGQHSNCSRRGLCFYLCWFVCLFFLHVCNNNWLYLLQNQWHISRPTCYMFGVRKSKSLVIGRRCRSAVLSPECTVLRFLYCCRRSLYIRGQSRLFSKQSKWKSVVNSATRGDSGFRRKWLKC